MEVSWKILEMDLSWVMWSVCWSGLHGPIAYSLLGGVVPITEQRLCGTLDSVPLSFKVTTFCTRLRSPPDGVRGVSPLPPSTPLHWSHG